MNDCAGQAAGRSAVCSAPINTMYVKPRHLAIAQPVMVKNLHPGPTWIPGTVVRQLGPVSSIISEKLSRHPLLLFQRLSSLNADDDSSIPNTVPSETVPTPGLSSTPPTNMETVGRYPQRNCQPPNRFVG